MDRKLFRRYLKNPDERNVYLLMIGHALCFFKEKCRKSCFAVCALNINYIIGKFICQNVLLAWPGPFFWYATFKQALFNCIIMCSTMMKQKVFVNPSN